MADIEMQRRHALGLEGARSRAREMADDLSRKFGLKGDWVGDVLRFERPGLNGSLSISASDVRLSVALGFLLKAMKPSIERAITQELDSLFSDPKPGGGTASASGKPASPARKPATEAKRPEPRKPPSSRKKGS